MFEIVNEYEKDGYIYKEYSPDGGVTITHHVKELIPFEYDYPETPIEPKLTVEEMQAQTLINTEYLVTMSELSNLKGE
jgi:hypothetical protein